MKYTELKAKHEKVLNDFPMIFAFNANQLQDGMKRLDVIEHKGLVNIGSGGYIRKSDLEKFKAMGKQFDKDMETHISSDETGTGFIKDMFKYELNNHEYMITYDVDDTLQALSMTMDYVEKYDNLYKGLQLAIKEIESEYSMRLDENFSIE